MEKNKVGVWVLAIVIFLMFFGIAAWRFYLSPIRIYDSGSSMWKHEMHFIEKKSFWPVTTHYGVHSNGSSTFINDKLVSEKSWIEFILWNGHGINTIEVWGVTTNSILYPTKKDVRSFNYNDDSISVTSNFTQSGTYGNRYTIIGVKPSEDETKLRIIVTDVKGNVTEDIVETNKII